MRAAAEIDKVRSQRVFGKYAVRPFLDQFHLHPFALSAVLLQAQLLGRQDALKLQILTLQLVHALLELLQIVTAERLAAQEIVIETVIDRRTDPELCSGKKFQNRRRQQMRGRMAVDVEGIRILVGQDLHRRIAVQRARKVPHFAVHFSD